MAYQQTQLSALKESRSLQTIGDLEVQLLEIFPRAYAESWDRTGLLVGDRHKRFTKVVCALDVTREAISFAQKQGAEVLVTHHPVFLDPPKEFIPSLLGQHHPGMLVYDAISKGVALMNFHTALDASQEAFEYMPRLLGLHATKVVEQIEADPERGYGYFCPIDPDAELYLSDLASQVMRVFGRPCRVWKATDEPVSAVVYATGSASSLTMAAKQAGADVLIAGEVRYHSALDAVQAGLSIIELGHDVSELPFAKLLAHTIQQLGITADKVTVYSQDTNWYTPSFVRNEA